MGQGNSPSASWVRGMLAAWTGAGARGAGATLLGGAALALGARCLVSGNPAFTLQPLPGWIPAQRLVAAVVGAVMIAGGAGLMARKTARPAALLLMLNFAFWALLLHGPVVARAPLRPGNWGGVGEIAIVIAGCWLLWRGSGAAAVPAWLRRACGLAILVVGSEHWSFLRGAMGMVPAYLGLAPAAKTWVVYVTGGFHLAAGLALLSGVQARLAARWWAGMISLFALMVWAPLVAASPALRPAWTELLMSAAVAGAGWVLAGSLKTAATVAVTTAT